MYVCMYVCIYVYMYIYIYIYIYKYVHLHMAPFQLGSFLVWLVSNGAQFKLHSFLMICQTRNDKR